jgi:hypothetical protein
MAEPFRDAEASAKARVAELEEKHAALEAEIVALRKKNDDENSLKKIELLEIQIHELKYELMKSRDRSGGFRIRGGERVSGPVLLFALLPGILFLLIMLAVWMKQNK